MKRDVFNNQCWNAKLWLHTTYIFTLSTTLLNVSTVLKIINSLQRQLHKLVTKNFPSNVLRKTYKSSYSEGDHKQNFDTSQQDVVENTMPSKRHWNHKKNFIEVRPYSACLGIKAGVCIYLQRQQQTKNEYKPRKFHLHEDASTRTMLLLRRRHYKCDGLHRRIGVLYATETWK